MLGVGDDEQSIYSFFSPGCPGGHPALPRRLSGERRLRAHGQPPLRIGDHPLGSARHRDPPGPRPQADALRAADGAPEGEAALLAFDSNASEARGVATLVDRLVNEGGLEPSLVLVLFRGDHNNMFSRPIKNRLGELGIPVDDPSWVDDVVTASQNRTALLLLRLLADPEDSLAWAGLLKLEHGVGPAFARAIYDRATESRVSFGAALLAAFEGGLSEGSGAARISAHDLITRVLAWLDRQEPPDELDDGRWGAWIIEALNEDPSVVPPTDGPEHGFHERTPLWYYLLKEAERQGRGNRLGEVGSPIVSEVSSACSRETRTRFCRRSPTGGPRSRWD